MARFQFLPLRVLLPLFFVFMASLWLGIGFVVMPGDQPLVVRLIGTVSYAGAMTAFFGVALSRARHSAGSVDELSRMAAAMKAGAVPLDVDASTWIPMLEKWQNLNRVTRWLAPALFTGMGALSLWLASTAGLIWFVFTVFFLAALVFTTVSAWRSYNTLTGMLQELRSRESHVR